MGSRKGSPELFHSYCKFLDGRQTRPILIALGSLQWLFQLLSPDTVPLNLSSAKINYVVLYAFTCRSVGAGQVKSCTRFSSGALCVLCSAPSRLLLHVISTGGAECHHYHLLFLKNITNSFVLLFSDFKLTSKKGPSLSSFYNFFKLFWGFFWMILPLLGQLEVNMAHYSLKCILCGIKTPFDHDSPLHFGE